MQDITVQLELNIQPNSLDRQELIQPLLVWQMQQVALLVTQVSGVKRGLQTTAQPVQRTFTVLLVPLLHSLVQRESFQLQALKHAVHVRLATFVLNTRKLLTLKRAQLATTWKAQEVQDHVT